MPHRVGHAHAVLAQQPELLIPLGVRRRDHAAVAGGQHLARVEREAGDVAVRPADPFPPASQRSRCRSRRPRPRRAAGPLRWATSSTPRDRTACRSGARTGSPGSRADGLLDSQRVDVEAIGLDVDEHRRRAAVADGVGGGDERVADGDDLVAGADADGQQRQVQRGGAVRHGAGVRRADMRGELALEGRDLRPLGQPARLDHSCDGFDLGLAEEGLCDWDLRIKLGSSELRRVRDALLLPPFDQALHAFFEGRRRLEAEHALSPFGCRPAAAGRD